MTLVAVIRHLLLGEFGAKCDCFFVTRQNETKKQTGLGIKVPFVGKKERNEKSANSRS